MSGCIWFEARRTASAFLCVFACVCTATSPAATAQLQEARVTRIIQDVRLLAGEAAARPATVNDEVKAGTAVRTGTESRTELTFADLTITRLGANTIFSFNEGTRELGLNRGALLVQVPRTGAEVKISTAAVTAGVTGGTALFESNKGLPAKLLMLEGIGRFYPKGHPELAVIVHGGEMATAENGRISQPTKFNEALVYATSELITSFPPLANADLIMEVIAAQQAEIAAGSPGPASSDPLDTIDQAIAATFFPSSPAGPASKFGPLSAITSPNPYVINSGTQINTDPTIMTNGVTNLGKIFRAPAQDGDPALYFFGSTSAFDNSSGLNELLKQGNSVPMAAFKFNGLQLTGDPTITIPAGSARKLALISAADITSAAPGGALTFSGLDTVFLATVKGSINLTADISFSNIPSLIFYARGQMSNLVLASPINGAGTNARLFAEGSITINAGETLGNFVANAGVDFLNGTGKVVAQGINITAANNINFTTSNFASPAGLQGVFLLAGANANIDIRTDQSVFNKALSFVEIHGATINFTTDPAGTTLQFAPAALANFFGGTGGIQANGVTFTQTSNTMEFVSTGSIVATSIVGANQVTSSAGNVQTTGDLVANQIFAPTGSITSGGNLTGATSIIAGTTINATNTLLSPGVTAGGDIMAGHVEVQNVNPFGPPIATTLTAGAGGITPFVSASGSGLQHTFNVTTIVSPNGIDFSGSQFGTGADGGILTINAQSQDFSAAAINGANFNGADAPAVPGATPGNGGALTATTSGDLNVNGVNITATTGIIDTNAAQPLGAGGVVNLTSNTGTVSVNSRIQVSSADPAGTASRRSSARGGSIVLQSGAASGVAINVTNTAQLLSLLENAAPGPGGMIVFLATGASSSINASGQIEADHGAVDIRHAGDAGQITLNNANLRGDIIKVAALGPNSTLNIGGGVLNADTVLKLYAPGSNGSLNFVANCSIGGGNLTILAANSVTINAGVTVNVTGHIADVFVNSTAGTPNANYSANFGGNGSTTGTFGGLGANNPQPLTNAPLLGQPGGP